MTKELLRSKEFIESCKRLSDKHIKDGLEQAKCNMKNDTINGDQISKRLFPKIYRDKYRITNLWRYSIGSYRLLYTIISENGEKKYAIINILTHKEYELLGYHTS